MGISKPWVSLPQTMIVIGFFWPTKTHVHIHRNKETVMPVWDQDWPAGSSLSTNYIPRALCNSCVCWTFCLGKSNKISQAEKPHTPWMPPRNTEFGWHIVNHFQRISEQGLLYINCIWSISRFKFHAVRFSQSEMWHQQNFLPLAMWNWVKPVKQGKVTLLEQPKRNQGDYHGIVYRSIMPICLRLFSVALRYEQF